MIEVIYGNNKELARLTGKSIADVRDQYKSQFDIPDRAQAVLNGKTLTKGLEKVTRVPKKSPPGCCKSSRNDVKKA